MTNRSSRSLAVLALLLAAAASAAPGCSTSATRPESSSAPPATVSPVVEHGLRLFARHCALCHGERGDGRGPAAEFLFPAPRDFTRGQFLLVSTPNGAPNDADLVRVLRRGMPGSAMPSWNHLPARDLLALAQAVRQLAVDGLAERLENEALERGEQVDGLELAREWLEPMHSLPAVEAPPANQAVLARGRTLYEQSCAACHGADGRGEREPRWNDDGSLNWARDFGAGVLKGGASFEELSWRLQCGLPGTAMPAVELNDADLGALVRWVQMLAPEEASWRLVQQPKVLRAVRVMSTPQAVDDIEWNAGPQTRFVLSPLSWDRDAIFELSASAVHDGEQLAIRLRWDDPSEDGPGGELLADALALAFAAHANAPLVGMGSGEDPLAIWYWRAAARPSEQSALAPHETLGGPAAGASSVRKIEARSFGSLETGPDAVLQAQARRTATGWEVIFVHPLGALTAGGPEGLALVARRSLPFALACWNGGAGDRAGRKSFTIWQQIALE